MIAFLVAIATLTAAVYFYFLHKSTYWTRRGVPQVRQESIIFGNSKSLFIKNEPRILKQREWTKEYGTVYGLREGSTNILVTSDPDMVNEIFFKQFDNFYSRKTAILSPDVDKDPKVHLFFARGARWKRLRAISAPSFSTSALKNIRPIIEDSAMNLVRIMEERHLNKGPFNIHEFYMEYTMDTISRLVMGQKESTLFNNHRLPIVKEMFMKDFDIAIIHLKYAFPFIVYILRMVLHRVNTPLTRAFQALRTEMENAVRDRIKQRESNPKATITGTQDFIDIFLNYSADPEPIEQINEFKLSDSKVSKSLSVDEVVSQCIVFLLAGFDTTANALAYTSWMLSKNPEVMRKCQEEIDEICQDESISFEDLANLKYLEATCKETLRFFPLGAFANSRTCMKTTQVCGYEIEEGTDIQVDTFTLHFKKKIYGEDAEEFVPERWLDDSRRVPPNAYIPFGAGPRICVGMRLALMEEKMALAHLLKRFNFVKGITADKLDLHGSLTLTPKTVPIKIVRRS